MTHEVAIVCRGGAGPGDIALARALDGLARVTVLVGSRSAGAAPLEADVVVVDEPPVGEAAPYYCDEHAWSAAVRDALEVRFPQHAPRLLVFRDAGGEALVTLQARRTADPWLDRTCVAVRLTLTREMEAVLGGAITGAFAEQARDEAERYCLRHADLLLDPGGDVLGTYGRFYGHDRLARAADVPVALPPPAPHAAAPPDVPLRLLYLGALGRREGVTTLVRAMVGVPGAISLTVAGPDTATGPGGTSVLALLEEIAVDDERITLLPEAGDADALIDAHHAVIVPATWTGWPDEALRALARGRPLVASNVGGLSALLGDERAGIAVDGTGTADWAAQLDALARAPARVTELARTGAPREAYEALAAPEAVRAAYAQLLEAPAPVRRRAAPAPTVSIVMPYFGMKRFVEEAVASVRAQTYDGPVEIVIVDDGSFDEEDDVLDRIRRQEGVTVLTQPTTGAAAARNLGVACSRGCIVVPFDPDDVLEPGFLERCVAGLDADEDLAYVTAWSRWIEEDGAPVEGPDDGHCFYGNWSGLMEAGNVAGTVTAALRREIFDAGFRWDEDAVALEDWLFFRGLHRAGLHGDVVPRRLFNYRRHSGSGTAMVGAPHAAAAYAEMNATVRRNEVRWQP